MKRALLTAVVAGAGVLALAACTPGTPAPTSSPTSTATSAAPSSTPTPIASEAAAPSARLPYDCDDLASAAVLSAAINVTVDTNDYVTPDSLEPWIFQQDGALECGWSPSDDGPASSADTFVTVKVIPDLAQEDWATFAQLIGAPGRDQTFGKNSQFTCQSGVGGGGCALDVFYPLSGAAGSAGTWLDIQSESTGLKKLTSAQTNAKLLPLFKTIASTVQSAKATEPRWSNPSATDPKFAQYTPLTDAQVAAAVGVKVSAESSGPDIQAGAYWGAARGVNDRSGIWGSSGGALSYTVDVLPGGSWAMDAVAQADAKQKGHAVLPGVASWSGAGSGDRAVEFEFTENGFTLWVIHGTVGGNLYDVTVGGQGAARSATAKAQALLLAKGLVAHIGG